MKKHIVNTISQSHLYPYIEKGENNPQCHFQILTLNPQAKCIRQYFIAN